MAKEHEKTAKVNNAPRKICSLCEIVSNGNIICATFRAVVGCRGSKAPDFEGLVFLGKGAEGKKYQRLSLSAPFPGELGAFGSAVLPPQGSFAG